MKDRRTAGKAGELPLRDVGFDVQQLRLNRKRAALTTRFSYRLAGLGGRWSVNRRFNMVNRNGRWLINRETGRTAMPWEVARYRLEPTRHFRVLAPTGVDSRAAGLPALLESAYAQVRQRLPRSPLQRRYLVLIAGDARAARRLVPELPGVEGLSAVTDAALRVEGPAQRVSEVVSLRVIVPWSRFTQLSSATRQEVLTHELAHVALARRTSGRTPAWLQEGFALYVSRDDRRALAAAHLATTGTARAARRGLSLSGLARPTSIAQLSHDQLSPAYAYSSAAAFYIADVYGERRLMTLLREFGNPEISGPAGSRLTDRVMRKVLRVSSRRFERGLRTWIQTGGASG